jgi:Predicted transcriptional regulators
MDSYKQKKIGNNLKTLRISYGYTQSQVAGMLSMSRQTYLRYESGNIIPRIDVIIDLAELYSLQTDKLLIYLQA